MLVPVLLLPRDSSRRLPDAAQCASMLKVISPVRIRRVVVDPRGAMAAVGSCRNGPQLSPVRAGDVDTFSHLLLVRLFSLQG